MGAALELSKNH